MVLLRADGTPTYMLSVVVDDHDMEVSHVIRGDDHLTNAFRQTQLFEALGWPRPEFAHIPLIHGADGAKLSKRHGALGVEAYREMGYLPAALRNYLLRLGWAHGDDEVISTEQAIAWFDLGAVGRAPARFDFAKLDNLNGHYIRKAADDDLAELVAAQRQATTGYALDGDAQERLRRAMPSLKQRAKTINELTDNAMFYVIERPLELSQKALKLLPEEGRARLGRLLPLLADLDDWSEAALEAQVRAFAEAEDCKLGQIAQPLRAALSGSHASPGIFEVMAVLGRGESLGRIADQNSAP
jgi:glutamyl-tRNA synthetase